MQLTRLGSAWRRWQDRQLLLLEADVSEAQAAALAGVKRKNVGLANGTGRG